MNTSDVVSLVVNGAKHFAKKNPIVTSMYFIGLFAALFGSGISLTADQRRKYDSINRNIDDKSLFDASHDFVNARNVYDASKGWFWSCDAICTRNKANMERAKFRLDQEQAKVISKQNEAKRVAGVFSEVGVQEVRDSFWSYFNRGKQFAKRSTMYDAMFGGFRAMARDESTGEYMMKLLLQALMNFTIGFVMCFVFFTFGLYSIIRSYSPDPFTAVAFFIVALCAGFATTVSVVLGIWGTAAGAVYTVAKVAESQGRLEGGRGERARPGFIRNGNLHRD